MNGGDRGANAAFVGGQVLNPGSIQPGDAGDPFRRISKPQSTIRRHMERLMDLAAADSRNLHRVGPSTRQSPWPSVIGPDAPPGSPSKTLFLFSRHTGQGAELLRSADDRPVERDNPSRVRNHPFHPARPPCRRRGRHSIRCR